MARWVGRVFSSDGTHFGFGVFGAMFDCFSWCGCFVSLLSNMFSGGRVGQDRWLCLANQQIGDKVYDDVSGK